MFSSAMSAEILRICKAATKFQDIKPTKILIGRIIKQGGLINHMKKALLKLAVTKNVLSKFGKTNNYILDKLL